jgi:hypothetical protein
MIKRNIMIQEQVLVMIMAATGHIPAAFEGAPSKDKGSPAGPATTATKPAMKGAQDNEEEIVLQQVLQ